MLLPPLYGKSDKPAAVADYDIHQLTADLVGILDALGEKSAILIGHDWGATVTWHAMLLQPGRFTALVAMSVPYSSHGPASATHRRCGGHKATISTATFSAIGRQLLS